MQRRGFLGAMLAAASAPAFVKAESLMGLYLPKPYAMGGFVSARTFLFGEDRLWMDPINERAEPLVLAQQRLIRYNMADFEAEMILKIAVGLSIPFAELTKEFPLINEPAKR